MGWEAVGEHPSFLVPPWGGATHSRRLRPPGCRPPSGLRASALGPRGPELRRGLGSRSSADPGSRLPAPCEGVRGPRGAWRSPAEVS